MSDSVKNPENSSAAGYMKHIPLKGSGTYGFIYSYKRENTDTADLRAVRSLSSPLRLPALPERFAVTGDFDDLARNHCCATMVTNLLLLKNASSDSAVSFPELRELFIRVHRKIGNGPILYLPRRGRNAFTLNNRSFTYRKLQPGRNCDRSDSLFASDIRQAINTGHPLALMLADSLSQMHWVTVVGCFDHGEEFYLELQDSWHQNLCCYRPGHGSRILSCLEIL